jgi:predicted outer membrane repeat protein
MIDSFGDGWEGASWTLKEAGGEVVVAGPYTFSSGASATQVFTAWIVPNSTAAPTASPTAAPTAYFNNINLLNWADLSATCSGNACDTSNGGCAITLSDDFVMGSYSGEIDFSGKAITVECSGATLDAASHGRFFYGKGSGSSLTLRQCSLTRGRSDTAIYPLQHVSVGGGAIYTRDGAILEIYTSEFKNNNATGSGGAMYHDGGTRYDMYHDTTYVIHDSTFQSNSADSFGGAIMITGDLKIYDSTFESNTAPEEHGGAIRVQEGDNVEIYASQFIGNSAAMLGGAISIYFDMDVKIYNTEFISNQAREGGALSAFTEGEAIDVEIHESTFQSNTANEQTCAGGTNYGQACNTDSQCPGSYCQNWQYSDSQGTGGAIYGGGSASFEVHDSTFESNTADRSGGAIFAILGSNVEIHTSIFRNNSAREIESGDLLYLDASSVAILDKCTIDHDEEQRDYFAQGTLVVRDTVNSAGAAGLAFEKKSMHPTSVNPAASAGLCPAFSTQTVDWKCVNPLKTFPGCDNYGDAVGQYPWGIRCGNCTPGTAKAKATATSAAKYPFLNWACKCPAGNAGANCGPCPSGYYMPSSSTIFVPECIACSPGMYADSSGSSACTLCPAGQFGADKGLNSSACSGKCTLDQHWPRTHYCPLGSTSKNQSECTQCDMSTKGPVMRDCTVSSAGYCADCIPGRFVNTTSAPWTCVDCEHGQYSMASNVESCTVCAAGSIANTGHSGANSCSECSAGKYSVQSNVTECTACTAGRHQSQSARTSCVACPVGKYQSQPGKSYCNGVPAGFTIAVVETKYPGGNVVREQVKYRCPHSGIDCSGTPKLYTAVFGTILGSESPTAVRRQRQTSAIH